MKKALIYALSLALVLAVVLAACGKQQSDQPGEPDPTQAAASEPVQEPPEQTPITPEPLSDKTPVTPDVTEANQPPEETESQDVEEIKLFEDCNETVYATGTVNIRESYTADSTKLGSLSAGQSVVRTGVAIAGTDAEGWSRVQLSNGTIAYISSKYLSTTKPVTQSSGNTQRNPTGQPQGGGTTTTTTTPPAGGGDTDADLEARKQAFLNGMGQMFEDNGYNTDGKDHGWTEEEKQALINSVEMGG